MRMPVRINLPANEEQDKVVDHEVVEVGMEAVMDEAEEVSIWAK